MAKQTLFEKLVDKQTFQTAPAEKGIRYSLTIKIIIIAITILVISLFYTINITRKSDEATDHSISPGVTWQKQTIEAEFSFPVYKTRDIYLAEQLAARQKALMVFRLNKETHRAAIEQLNKVCTRLPEITESINDNAIISFSDAALKPYLELSIQEREKQAEYLRSQLARFLKNIYKNGYINSSKDNINNSEIKVLPESDNAIFLKTEFLTDKSEFDEKSTELIDNTFPDVIIPIAKELIGELMEPNLIYSEELTEKEKELADQSVKRTIGIVYKGDVIIEKGERINEENLPKIKAYFNALQIKKNKSDYSWTVVLGNLGHATIIYTMLLFFLIFFRRRIFADNVRLSVLSLLMVLVSMLSWLSIELPNIFPLEYLICLPAFSMLAAILFDSRTAFYTTVTMGLMLAGIRGNDYQTGLAMMFAGSMAAYTVRDIQSRTQMFQSIFYIFIGLVLPILVFGLERSSNWLLMLKRMGLALINAAIAPLITYGLLFIIERISNITTDLRIKEYDNLNHSLLQKMSENAPGTYQHTLSVAQLAERCAIAINANPLLTRVGTYFHDIGKMAKPEYFTENQMDIGNKHDMLPPKKSAEAIKNHVINGIELAKKYKLPQRIINFIPMHHGTTLIKHFYAKALEESKEDNINENDFRYPGPKPNSKETVILMICDSAEAISRIDSKSKEEIEEIIDKNIKDRMFDGQFDESGVTMKDLKIIKETISSNLLGKSHKRVSYKEIPPDKQKK